MIHELNSDSTYIPRPYRGLHQTRFNGVWVHSLLLLVCASPPRPPICQFHHKFEHLDILAPVTVKPYIARYGNGNINIVSQFWLCRQKQLAM